MPLDAVESPLTRARLALADALAALPDGGALALTLPPGAGKTHAITAWVGASRRPTLISVPTRELGRDYAEALGAHQHVGRQGPDGDPRALCHRLGDVQAAGDRHHMPAASVCRQCPHGLARAYDEALARRDDWKARELARLLPADREQRDAIPRCRWIYEALRDTLTASISVITHQAYADSLAIWGNTEDERAARDIVIDEPPDLVAEIAISAADVTQWIDRADWGECHAIQAECEAEDRAKRARTAKLRAIIEAEINKHAARAALCRDVRPVLEDLGHAILERRLPDEPLRARIAEIVKRAKAAGAFAAGTAPWERIWLAPESGIEAPLRALAALDRSLRTGVARVAGTHLAAYEPTQIGGLLIEPPRRHRVVVADATASPELRAVIAARGGQVLDLPITQNVRIRRMIGRTYGRGPVEASKYSAYARGLIARLKHIAAEMPKPAAILTHRAYLDGASDGCAEELAERFEAQTGVAIGWWGRDERGHNRWIGRHIAIVGMRLLGPHDQASLYARARAAAIWAGADPADWPEWDGSTERYDGVAAPLPTVPAARRWWAERLAADLVQAIGRARAVSHTGAAPIEVRIYGGVWWPDLYQALDRYGLHVDEECPEAVEPPPEERIRRTALALHERGFKVSASEVARALQGQEAGARRALIVEVLAELRSAGLLPPGGAGRPRKSVPAPYSIYGMGTDFSGLPHSPPDPIGSAPQGGPIDRREESPSPPPAPLVRLFDPLPPEPPLPAWQLASPGSAAAPPGAGSITHRYSAQPNPLYSQGPRCCA